MTKADMHNFLEDDIFKRGPFSTFLADSFLSWLAGEAPAYPDGAIFDYIKDGTLRDKLAAGSHSAVDSMPDEHMRLAAKGLQWIADLFEELQRHAAVSGINYGFCIAGPWLEMLPATGRKHRTLFGSINPPSESSD